MRSPIRADDTDDTKLVKPGRFLKKTALFVLLVGVSAIAITQTEYPTRLAFQLVLAAVLAHGTELIHECIHRLATGREKVDRCLGSILGQTTFISFAYYRFSHLRHHRYVGTEQDRDSFSDHLDGLQSRCRRTRIRSLVRHLSMADHWCTAIRRLAAAAAGRLSREMVYEQPDMPPAVARKVQRDYRVMGATAVLSLCAACWGLPIVDMWLVPLALWTPIHAAIELPEHYACEQTENIERNTRSIRGGRLATWLTNANCFHVGHHLRMDVPFHQLRDFESNRQSGIVHQEPSYWAFYKRVVSDVFAKKRAGS